MSLPLRLPCDNLEAPIEKALYTREKLAESDYFTMLTSDFLLVYDFDWNIVTVNSAVEEILGYKPEEVIGKSCVYFLHPEDREYVKKIIESNVEKKVYNISRILCRNGSYKWFEWNTIPLEKENRIFAVGRDITEKKQIMEQLLKSERLNLISQLGAGIGHEIRNPLQSVRGYLQFLKRKYYSDIDCFDLMISELDRANHIITEFLSLSKNKSDNPKLLNINSVIKDIFPLIQSKAFLEEKDVHMELKSSQKIVGDEEELKQLILNLAQNGIEAMDSRKKLTLKTFTEGSKVVLAVIDEGKGIDPEIKSKLGTPFVTSIANRTGLGLAISYNIAERHKAKIEVETSSRGTSFLIKFPAV
ncbi:PAS domain S-box protein [Heliorestis acidaminivorans]|uniref:histidine kinase n=1 Tax=Heliorestis acidaminivorans TaxID=553427 RepID=A0A6I0EYH5_9FIRM|nr:PAS domain S-box protein [Heliorestis acidaminivorans]KAB2952370.1 PAS domain S-box protein [Heliorestis acidaminivorans]